MGGKDRFDHADQTMPESYRPWDGAQPMPHRVHATDTVEVWFRVGRSSTRPRQAQVYSWRHTGGTGDIIGWRFFPAESGLSDLAAKPTTSALPPDEPNLPNPPSGREKL